MRPLSATECITPAIERTRLVLFKPFRKGRTWKLSATAYLCRIGTMFFPFPLIYLALLPAAHAVGRAAEIGLVAGTLVGTALFTWIFYLCSRLQFAYLDLLANHGELVAPAWRKYRHTLPWTGLKIAIGSGAALVCALPIAAYLRHILPLLHAMQTLRPGQPPPPQFMAALFAGYGVIFLVLGPVFLVSSLLSDFIVPSLALEDTPLREAFRRMLLLVRGEPGEFALYTLLKTILAIALYMGSILAIEIVFFLVLLVVLLVAALAGFLLHLMGVPSAVLGILAILLYTSFSILFLGYGMILAMGATFTFLDAYALYFLGGRYPLLGDLLDRSTPPPVAYPYPYPYPPPPYYPPPPPPLTP